ncbi:MAG: nucleotidyltransferase domain-containing protein [Chloroflexota bacterium]
MEKELKESKELKEMLVKHGVVLAYLFGSHAKGTARASSDVDIAVLLPYDTPRSKFFDVRLALTNELMSLLHKNEIDLVVLNEATPLLAYQVVKYGKAVYENEAAHPATTFAVYTLNRYADTAPFREVQQQYLFSRIKKRKRERVLV